MMKTEDILEKKQREAIICNVIYKPVLVKNKNLGSNKSGEIDLNKNTVHNI
jgi:hypothetical protein